MYGKGDLPKVNIMWYLTLAGKWTPVAESNTTSNTTTSRSLSHLFVYILADVHARTLKDEQTAMHFASKYNSCEAILALLELGARLDDRDYKQRTPLQVAAETGLFF